MLKSILYTLFFLFFLTNVSAQWSIGARFGGSSGLSIKNYPASNGILFEAITAHNFDENVDGFAVSLLGEKLGAFSESGKFGAILGVGETMVFADEFTLGLSGILGFDWRLGKIGVQLDWMPTWLFINESYFTPVNVAFTARWIFGRKASYKG